MVLETSKVHYFTQAWRDLQHSVIRKMISNSKMLQLLLDRVFMLARERFTTLLSAKVECEGFSHLRYIARVIMLIATISSSLQHRESDVFHILMIDYDGIVSKFDSADKSSVFQFLFYIAELCWWLDSPLSFTWRTSEWPYPYTRTFLSERRVHARPSFGCRGNMLRAYYF